MKKKHTLVLLLLFVLLLGGTGCSQNDKTQAKEEQFTATVETEIKKKTNKYTEKEFQTADVPLNDFVQLTGEITRSDGDETLKKGDRFILKSGSSNYQIFNEQEYPFSIGDRVTVYGEYYGFIKAIAIEKEESK